MRCPAAGRNAYLRFGQAEAEIIEPEDKSGVGSKILDMHHVGYVVESIERAAEDLRARGFAFGSDTALRQRFRPPGVLP